MFSLACVLWLGAPIIAGNVAQDIEYSNEHEFRHTTQNWWNIGREMLGLYFLVTGLTGFFATVFNIAGLRYGGKTMALSFGSLQNLQLFYFMPAVSSLMTAIAGVWLLLVARRDSKREFDSTPI